MNIYRGIKLVDTVRLYKKDGSYYDKVKNGLDVFVDKLTENTHELLSEFINDNTKVLIDFKCGHEPHLIKPSMYKLGNGCPKCGGKCPEQAKEDLLNMLKSNGHSLLSEYIDNSTKILIDFHCGHEPYPIPPSDYKRGRGCSKCGHIITSEKRSKQSESDLNSLLKINGDVLLSEYVNNKTNVVINFNCGHEPHSITPNAYKRGNRCPICKESKGERKVREWLERNNVEFETQMVYDGLVGLGYKNLSYDFYIKNQNILIEYQGEFHDGTAHQQTKEEFIIQQEHDRRKREYAELHSIELLEIWYWNYENVELILNKLILQNEHLEVDENFIVQ